MLVYAVLTSPLAACIEEFLWHTAACSQENPKPQQNKTHFYSHSFSKPILKTCSARHVLPSRYLSELAHWAIVVHWKVSEEGGCMVNEHWPSIQGLISLLTLPTLCSEVVQESIKVWAMTDRTASTLSVTCTSNTNWGFFRMFTQNRRGKLKMRKRKKWKN